MSMPRFYLPRTYLVEVAARGKRELRTSSFIRSEEKPEFKCQEMVPIALDTLHVTAARWVHLKQCTSWFVHNWCSWKESFRHRFAAFGCVLLPKRNHDLGKLGVMISCLASAESLCIMIALCKKHSHGQPWMCCYLCVCAPISCAKNSLLWLLLIID